MFSNLNRQQQQERIMALYNLLCSDQEASIRFLDRVGQSLGTKTEQELKDHYHRCFAEYLQGIKKRRAD